MIINCKKKPVIIQAVQWNGYNIEEITSFTENNARFIAVEASDLPVLFIKTLEGDMRAQVGDYVLRGVRGEFYPCDRSIFEEVYEVVE